MIKLLMLATDRKIAAIEAEVERLDAMIQHDIATRQIGNGDFWEPLHKARVRLDSARRVRAALEEM